MVNLHVCIAFTARLFSFGPKTGPRDKRNPQAWGVDFLKDPAIIMNSVRQLKRAVE